jgi:phosphatidate phosphatase PAH1
MSAPFASFVTYPTYALSLVLVTMLCGCSGQLPPADIPPAQPGEAMAAVFDIDGTLTPKVHAMNTAREHAAEALNILADKGYRIIYLSARIRSHSAGIPAWLQANGFPDGTVHAAQTADDRKQPAVFKITVLNEYNDRGWSIQYAYGDSSTDFEAYAAAGIPKERVFALQREGDTSCQPGEWSVCLGGWTEHLDHLRHSVLPVSGD